MLHHKIQALVVIGSNLGLSHPKVHHHLTGFDRMNSADCQKYVNVISRSFLLLPLLDRSHTLKFDIHTFGHLGLSSHAFRASSKAAWCCPSLSRAAERLLKRMQF